MSGEREELETQRRPERRGLALLIDFTGAVPRRSAFFPSHPRRPTESEAVRTLEELVRGAVVDVDEELLLVRAVAWLDLGAHTEQGAGARKVVVAALEPSGYLVATRGDEGDLRIDGEGYVADRVRHVPDELSLAALLAELGAELRAGALAYRPLAALFG